MSIAGLDPSAGAGLLADIKTFEQLNAYGLGIPTAVTLQTEKIFYEISWEKTSKILESVDKLTTFYNIQIVKIGIVKNIQMLNSIVSLIHCINPKIKIILDPVFRSSSGFSFWKNNREINEFTQLLTKIFLITPNYPEMKEFYPSLEIKEGAASLAKYCHVFLKGGHDELQPGIDYLYSQSDVEIFESGSGDYSPKHGSGCVLSSAVAAYLALGLNLSTACYKAKLYVSKFLSSNKSLLGYHHVE
ncbi:MAG: hydroxymethylpyrimidine/phosphomethylpyrimidine kinase [Chitinophagaceae bacterium]